jgi:hypothetical protein
MISAVDEIEGVVRCSRQAPRIAGRSRGMVDLIECA